MRKKDRAGIKTILFIMGFLILMMSFLVVSTIDISRTSFRVRMNDNHKIVVSFRSKNECYVAESKKKEEPDDKANWIKATNNSVTFDLHDDIRYYYIKCKGKIYYAGSSENKAYGSVEIKSDLKYLIVGEKYNIDYKYEKHGNTSQDLKWTSSNNKVASVENGVVSALGSGEVTITASILGKESAISFVVTDLIQKMPAEFNEHKELLACGRYSEEENDLLDEILEYRINEAGYKTRGGVVAATRFLLLEFPYRLTYFYEWGRQNWDKVDGEGRYYIKGLYLDESRFSRLIGSNKGPQTWGCTLYSDNIKAFETNGLDCSGFVTWVLLNAGFDCGDIGSGFSENYDLTETGELVKNSEDTLKRVKVGDLTHSTYMGGHIGILIGMKNGYYYVAQATPKNGWGVTITKYNAKEFIKEWQEMVLMDSYYMAEGKYTEFWK